MMTRSPTRLSLRSSWALSFLDCVTTRWYCGWRKTRSIFTTRVFCMASLTTTPSRVLRSPTGLMSSLLRAFAQHGLRPRQILARLVHPRRVLRHAHRELEPEIEDLLRELRHLLSDFVVGEVTPLRHFHAPSPGSERARPHHELGRDPDFLRRRPERLARVGLGHALHLVENAARLHHRDPFLRVALALSHAGLRRLLRHRFVGKDPDPHLAAPLEAPRERDARR